MVVVRYRMENVCLFGGIFGGVYMMLLREGAGKIVATIFDLG